MIYFSNPVLLRILPINIELIMIDRSLYRHVHPGIVTTTSMVGVYLSCINQENQLCDQMVEDVPTGQISLSSVVPDILVVMKVRGK